VLNKLDLIPVEERERRIAAFVKALRWKGPVFGVSALSGAGCRALVRAAQGWLDKNPQRSAATVE
jgi:GTP-binding protein